MGMSELADGMYEVQLCHQLQSVPKRVIKMK
jgi:hypothetical protein